MSSTSCLAFSVLSPAAPIISTCFVHHPRIPAKSTRIEQRSRPNDVLQSPRHSTNTTQHDKHLYKRSPYNRATTQQYPLPTRHLSFRFEGLREQGYDRGMIRTKSITEDDESHQSRHETILYCQLSMNEVGPPLELPREYF